MPNPSELERAFAETNYALDNPEPKSKRDRLGRDLPAYVGSIYCRYLETTDAEGKPQPVYWVELAIGRISITSAEALAYQSQGATTIYPPTDAVTDKLRIMLAQIKLAHELLAPFNRTRSQVETAYAVLKQAIEEGK